MGAGSGWRWAIVQVPGTMYRYPAGILHSRKKYGPYKPLQMVKYAPFFDGSGRWISGALGPAEKSMPPFLSL